MKKLTSTIKFASFLILILLVANACNKDVEQFPDPIIADTSSQPALAAAIAADANYSLYNEVIKKSGYADTLNNKTNMLTMFVPTNAAVKAAINLLSGGLIPVNAPDATFIGFIQSSNFSVATANGLVKYNTIPQDVEVAAINTTSLNFQYPTMINPAPTVSALARLSTFLSKNNNLNYVNNVPVTSAKIAAGNGAYYATGAVVLPPTRFLWQRISEAADLNYLEAAVIRADSGLTAAQRADPKQSLQTLLSSFGPSITLFAPTDAVFQATLTQLITLKLVQAGYPLVTAQTLASAWASTPGVFTVPQLSTVLTPALIKGLLAYHILGTTNFTNNFPTTEKTIPTLISASDPSKDPQLKIKATFSGPSVTALTVQGAVNATAANVAINPTPEPAGNSDQFYVNGTLHKINQILLPQNF